MYLQYAEKIPCFLLASLKVKDENSRIRIKNVADPDEKCHGSTILLKRNSFLFLLGHISFQLSCDCPRKWDTRRSEERSDPNRRKSLKHFYIKNKIHNAFLLFKEFFSNCFNFLPLPTQLLGYLIFPCPVLNNGNHNFFAFCIFSKGRIRIKI
jgi:hypothetical protein